MKKSLTIEELKERIGKPVFVVGKPVGSIYGNKNWRILKSIGVNDFDKLTLIAFTDNSEISAEEQDKFRFFDTEVSKEDLQEILEEEEKSKKKTGYERVPKEKYYSVPSGLESINHYDDTFNSDDEKYNIANYFNDESLTINLARVERLKYQLRRFAALNGGIPSQEDWANKRIEKYYMCYDCYDAKIDVYVANFFKEFGQIYFKSEEACEKAIETFKDELLWYFTEFQETLH